MQHEYELTFFTSKKDYCTHELQYSILTKGLRIDALFAWLISHQPTVLFSQNKPATSNQPEPASSTLLSEQTNTSHQPPANRTGWAGRSCSWRGEQRRRAAVTRQIGGVAPEDLHAKVLLIHDDCED
jgi:hypothetical protein